MPLLNPLNPRFVAGVQLEFASPSDFVAELGAPVYAAKNVSVQASTEAPFAGSYPNGYCQDQTQPCKNQLLFFR